MIRWLITVPKRADLDRLAQVIAGCGGELDPDTPPTPLGGAELVIAAAGPLDVERLKTDPEVIEVYPDSEMQLY